MDESGKFGGRKAAVGSGIERAPGFREKRGWNKAIALVGSVWNKETGWQGEEAK